MNFRSLFTVFKADGICPDLQTAILSGDDIIAQSNADYFHHPYRDHYEVSKIALEFP